MAEQTNTNVTDLDVDDVLDTLEGEEARDFPKGGGFRPGTYTARITDLKPVEQTFRNGNKAHMAEFRLEMTDEDHSGWDVTYRMFMGRNQKGEWGDQTFLRSVRNILGEEDYTNEIAAFGSLGDQYRAIFNDLLKGRDCEITYAHTNPDDQSSGVFPRGALRGIADDATTPEVTDL